MNSQAGIMRHLASEPRNEPNMMPGLASSLRSSSVRGTQAPSGACYRPFGRYRARLAAGRHGLLRSLASGAALDPSTTWVPPSDRNPIVLTNGFATASLLLIP